jgi:acyl carrier protein
VDDLHGRIRAALHAHLARVSGANAARRATTDTTDLFEAGVVDSLAFVDMVAGAAGEVGLALDLSAAGADELSTIAGLARCLARAAEPRVGGGGSDPDVASGAGFDGIGGGRRKATG